VPGHPFQRLLAPAPRSAAGQPDGRLRFLGTAGFELVAADQSRLLLDPYLTRPGLLQTIFGRLAVNTDRLVTEIPRADAVLCGHSHYDHALDAPDLARHSGCPLIGSQSTLNIGRAAGLPESQLVDIESRAEAQGPELAVGSVRIGSSVAAALPSAHGRVPPFGKVPLPGTIDRPPSWPPRVTELRHGPVYSWYLDLGDVRMLHVDSADYRLETFIDVQVDVLLLCAIGRQYKQDYTSAIVRAVRPQVVIPCHWDDYTLPWGARPRQLPGCDVEAFNEEVRAAGSRAVVVGIGDRWNW